MMTYHHPPHPVRCGPCNNYEEPRGWCTQCHRHAALCMCPDRDYEDYEPF